MGRSLLIAVRFHQGRYHGQGDRFDEQGGWPPSPARLYQALIAGAARGATIQPEDRRAFEWLERLDPPRITAPAVRRGRATRLFVPNNDLDAVRGDPARVGEIRVGKQWRPCFFDPAIPVLFAWRFESGAREAQHICNLATRLYQLGRGIDMAWATGRVLDEDEAEATVASHPGVLRTPGGVGMTAVPRPGTFASLAERYQRKRERLATVVSGRVSRQLFTQPPKASFAHTGYGSPVRWLHFEVRTSDGNFAPNALASAAPLLTALRNGAAARLQKALPERAELFERLIIGRGAGPRDLAQRIRLIPIPSIGTEHTDPSLRRVTIEVPADCPIRMDDLKWAFAGLPAPQLNEPEESRLVSTDDARMAQRFAKPVREFRTITPVALASASRRSLALGDNKPANERIREEHRAAGAVVQALRHAGIRAKPTDIRVQREPFQRRGVRAELFAAGSRFSKHALWHVQFSFHEAVSGPLMIGDGRFCGLGLMEPVVTRPDAVVYELKRPVRNEDGPRLVGHLRRALMALARDDGGRVDALFSGHRYDGRPDNGGRHAHVFLAADDGLGGAGPIERLIVIAPWVADRRAKPRDRRKFDDVTRQLEDLRAGRLGRFDQLHAKPMEDGDTLIGPTTTWTNATPYVATRNLKKHDDPTQAIQSDVVIECRRRGLPAPTGVDVAELQVGPRGGRPTAMLTLRFAVSVRGPLLLGRNSHTGGGLFHAGHRSGSQLGEQEDQH
ncbi:MAG: type I-U CRISPR-associated protein Csb2 [Gammaproteobacteria bacterium]|nr:type I-U CRISPR-associated protein Csb2 [Gammaproteobacteria bacterium]MDE0432670.1 type I-U CRISPR-associated protein Csb2 [Bryobacterales bacterium]